MKALIVYGGWEGHEPDKVAAVLAGQLRKHDFQVELSTTLDSFADAAKLAALNLIVPVWTMGTISKDQLKGLLAAVKGGVGIAGVHGGMGDAFREATGY
ncbi:MAG: ThuA domain-containing protein, partial [Phycisphaerae bacterium]